MAARSVFWENVTRFDWSKVTPWLALRNAVGVVLPLAVGAAIGNPGGALIMTTGALNVSFSDGSDPYRERARRMLTASLCCALAVFFGGFVGRVHVVAATIAALVAFTAGMMVSVNQTAADIGTITLVTFVVFSAQPMTPKHAFAAGLLAVSGGLLQAVFSLALWPVRRYAPERRVLGGLFRELARAAASPARATEAPPASESINAAHQALAPLGADGSIAAERYLALLSQAERIRLALLTLSRLRVRIGRESGCEEIAALLDRAAAHAAQVLAWVGNALLEQGGQAIAVDELNAIGEKLRGCGAMARDARWQIEALAGQLRSAMELASHATPSGRAAFAAREAGQPWRLRVTSTWAVLRANLNIGSAAFRHAVRLALCVAIGDAAGRAVGAPRAYWIAMTIAIVLKPDFSATFTRGLLRLAGTIAGLLLATALFHLLAPALMIQVLLLGAFAFVLRCFGPANYGLFVTALTAMVVLMFTVTGVSPAQVMLARGINSIAGGLIALTAYAVWPTWERAQVSESVARMLEAYAQYFRAVRDGYLQPEKSFREQLDEARLAARLARSNLEASAARLRAEPLVPAQRIAALDAILANSHRFIHAVMAMEAGLVRSRPVPARAAFRAFAAGVDRTLALLASSLRGSPVAPGDFPDLREEHHALVSAGDPHEERYALVNVETDRVTNSLNTLTAEILRPS
jgi:uncharacterized membrane protein YccC